MNTKKILAILKKDFLIEASYKWAFFGNLFRVVATLLTFFFIDKLFGHRIAPNLEEFGVNYFSYVLLSIAMFSYVGIGMSSFTERIRQEQLQGTLEMLLLSPTKLSVIILSMGLWNLIFATLDILVYIVVGAFFFHIDFTGANLLSVAIILFLTIISFSSIGIISASFILVFKRGNPIDWMINILEGLLGGVYFPISVMPGFMQVLAKCIPITYAIRAMELAVYRGATLFDLRGEIIILTVFSIVLVPVSSWVFRYAFNTIRRLGTLAQY